MNARGIHEDFLDSLETDDIRSGNHPFDGSPIAGGPFRRDEFDVRVTYSFPLVSFGEAEQICREIGGILSACRIADGLTSFFVIAKDIPGFSKTDFIGNLYKIPRMMEMTVGVKLSRRRSIRDCVMFPFYAENAAEAVMKTVGLKRTDVQTWLDNADDSTFLYMSPCPQYGTILKSELNELVKAAFSGNGRDDVKIIWIVEEIMGRELSSDERKEIVPVIEKLILKIFRK